MLFHFLKKKGEERDLDLEEPSPPSRIPIDLGNPQNPLWPKKGPGSRGGKIRQRKVNYFCCCCSITINLIFSSGRDNWKRNPSFTNPRQSTKF